MFFKLCYPAVIKVEHLQNEFAKLMDLNDVSIPDGFEGFRLELEKL